MKSKALTTQILSLSMLALSPILLKASNPDYSTNCPTGGCDPETGDCYKKGKSYYWAINVGQVKYNNNGDFLSYSRVGQGEPNIWGSTPRSLQSIYSFYEGGNMTKRHQLRLELFGETITAALADPATLDYNHSTDAEVIKLNGYINQILTTTGFAHIEKLAGGDGFRVRVWSRSAIALGAKVGGLYPVPSQTPLNDQTLSNPDHPSDNNRLQVVSVDHAGAAPLTTTDLIEETISATTQKPETMKITTYAGSGTSGTKLKIEKLTYSNRGAKTWDYHVERQIWTASTAADGTVTSPTETAPFLTLHNYEEYKEFSNNDTAGQRFTLRMTRMVKGYNTVGAGEYVYTYYDTPTNIFTHGRLHTVTNPDGSWEYHEYTDSLSSPIALHVVYSSWKDITMANRANARKVTTTIESGKITVLTEIAGQQVAKREIIRTSNAANERITETRDWTGSEWRVSTVCRHPMDAAELTAGRDKWREHADGTATTYSYAMDGADTVITMRSGAGDRNGVTAGTETVTTFNTAYKEIAMTTKDIESTLQISSTTGSNEDKLGRPQRTDYHDGSFSLVTYGCCGVGNTTDRSGATAEYFRDDLRRVYRVTRKRSSGGTAVNTTTAYAGLKTTIKRSDGTTTLLVSETTESLNGLSTSTKLPDANLNKDLRIQTRTTEYLAGGGSKTTVQYPDLTTTETVTFLDGSTKSTTDQEGDITTYDKGTHNTNGGGIWTQTISPTTTQWTKTFADHLGRTYRMEYADGAYASTTYHPFTAAAGSRGKMASSNDPDENDTAGTGNTVSYGYNNEGERTTVTEPIADGHTRATVTHHDVIATVTVQGTVIAPAMRTTQTVNGVLVSTSYRAADGLSSGSVSFGRENLSTRTLASDGAWITTSVTADGSQSRQFYSDGLMKASVSYASGATLPGTAPADITAVNGTGFITGTSQTQDAFGRTLTTVDARTGTTTINGYHENGAVKSVTTNAGADKTEYRYDKMARRIQVILPDTSVTYTSYTARGQTLATWGSQTYARLYIYDALGRMIELRTYQNLAHGTEPTVATAGYAATKWVYHTQRGWLVEKNYDGETDDGTVDADYTYTPSGRLKTRTWERGVVTTYAYDKGSLDTVTYSNDPANTPNVAYTYDNFGRPLIVAQSKNGTGTSQALATITYAYDVANLVLDKETIAYDTNADGTADFTRVLDRSQDGLLRPDGFSLKNGATVEHSATYNYGTAGRLFTVVSGADTFTYTYEPKSYGLVKSVARTGGHTVDNAYEPNRNVLLSKNNHNGTPASPVSKYAYQTNDIGQRTDLTATGSAFGTAPVYKWKYNGAGELVEADDTATANDRAYQYDGIGNRQKTVNGLLGVLPATPNYVANSKNQYTTANGLVLPTTPAPAPYDEDGNMTRGALPASDSGTNATLVWDAENRLVSVTITKGGSTTTVNCSYDAQSRRTEKTIVGGASTLYVYDGWNLVTEYAGTSLSKSYTWGMDLSGSMQGAGGVGGLLNVELHTGSNTGVYYPTYDGNGNVSEYLDSTGAVVAHYEYDAFGNEITPTAQKGTQHGDFNHRFSTKYIDEETGLYYYGYRYYDAAVGRWINRDPIEERGGFNLYGFVENDGVNYWDYLGEVVLEKRSAYLDKNEKLKSNKDILAQLKAEGKYVERAEIDPRSGGVTHNGLEAYLQVGYDSETGKCKITGYIKYNLGFMHINNSPNRLAGLGTVQESINHELQHVRAFHARMNAIVEAVSHWMPDTFDKWKDAVAAKESYQKALDSVVSYHNSAESMHDPIFNWTWGGGSPYGTPREGEPHPGDGSLPAR